MTDAPGVTTAPTRAHLRVLRAAANTDPLELEATYAPHSPRPPEHFHPRQNERFEVLAGEFRTCIDGEERTYRPGDVFEIPAGVRHWMHNVSAAEGRLRWQIRPALKSQAMLEAFFGMAEDGARSRGRFGRLVAQAGLLRVYRDEFRLTRPPRAVQWVLMQTLGRLGSRGRSKGKG